MSLKVIPVFRSAEKRKFLNLPFLVYKDDPNWVCPLLSEQGRLLFNRRHPFWNHGYIASFIAQRDGETLGRISAVTDDAYNEFHGEKAGFFGFFEVLHAKDDPELAKEITERLLKRANRWLFAHGFDTLRGPSSPSSNYEWGLLVEGHDSPPVFLMPYNRPEYAGLLESCGMAKAMDVVSLYFEARELPEKAHRVARIAEKKGYRIRNADMKRFKQEAELMLDVYNDAWEKNWGFVPMDREEFMEQVHQMKPLAIPSLIKIVEYKDEPVGFALSMPDYNVALRKMHGRLFPFGIFRLMSVKRKPAKAGIARTITLGVKKAHRHRGVDALLSVHSVQAGHDLGIWEADFGWVLESNQEAIQLFEHMGGRVYKRYRIYERPIARPEEGPASGE
jgi:ribosomal protein S18 acetylase RimI-like enzyme